MTATTADRIPSHIQPKHWQEWVEESGIHPGIARLALESLEGQEIIERLGGTALEGLSSHAQQYATRGVQKIFEKYEQATQGGWWGRSLDPLNGWKEMDWGQFKPDVPRFDPVKPDKVIKYETPLQQKSRAFFCPVPFEVSMKTLWRITKYGETVKDSEIAAAASSRLEVRATRAFRDDNETDSRKAQDGGRNNETASDLRKLRAFLEACRTAQDGAADRLFRGLWNSEPGSSNGNGSADRRRVSRLGELGLQIDKGFWQWVIDCNLPIKITEGYKKAATMTGCGFPAIGLPGITQGVRTKDKQGNDLFQPELIPELQPFATEGRRVTICFDYENRPRQLRALEHEIEKLKIRFNKAKAKVHVAELPGPEKGIDDFLVSQGESALTDLLTNAPNFELWTVIRHSRLSYPADISLNQRYLGDLEIPDTAKLIGIKSPKGTGKTESFKRLVEEASARGQRTLLITHRVQLGQAICDRVYLPYVTELRTSAEGDLLGYGVCVDSLHPSSQARFNADDWDDALVIIDEAEQVFWHLLSGTTEIKHHRLEVMDQLQRLFNCVVESDRGRIVLSDADLSNQSIRFVLNHLDPETRCRPFIVQNDYRAEEAWQIYHYAQHRPEQWCNALLHSLAQQQKAFICTQSQKTKSRWSTTTLETLICERFPALKVLRIDSQTVADPQHAAYNCTAHLNGVLPNYDVVICSPTIETGVSIDLRGHFDAVWGCAQGVLSENSTRQFLARVRDPIPRHLWLSPFGVGRVGNGATSVRGLLAAEKKLATRHAAAVQYAGFGEDMLNSYGTVLNTWAVMGCRINAGAVHYREAVLWHLRQEGHQVVDVVQHKCTRSSILMSAGKVLDIDASYEAIDDLKDHLDVIKITQHEAECNAIAGADDLTEPQYKKLKGQKAKTQDQCHQERKYDIGDRYQVDVTPDLVSKDTDGWYPQLRLYYFMVINREAVKERDRSAFETQTSSGGAWLPSLNKSQLGLRVEALERLGIRKLMDTGEVFNGGTKAEGYEDAHAALLEIWREAQRHSWDVRTILGVTVSEGMSPIQCAQALLKKIGIKLNCKGQFGARGERQRHYRFELPDDGRDAIVGRWKAIDESRSDSAVHTPGNKDQYSAEVAA